MTTRYGIAEWYGLPFLELLPVARNHLATKALQDDADVPACPFQKNRPPCRKKGGICSIRQYRQGAGGRMGSPVGDPVIVCPARFEQKQVLVSWLAEIVGFPLNEGKVAREVPFMHGTSTNKPAGKIDLVVARMLNSELKWYGLEIQAVYFSGLGMRSEFEGLRQDGEVLPPFPNAIRRPDWRSSSAKRLMPQLQIKVPTLRRWASKLSVSVDRPFYESIGGPSPEPSHDLNDGDIIWLVPKLTQTIGEHFVLSRGHWEVLTLEDTNRKLLAAETIRREAFEEDLRTKLESIGD